MENENTTQHLIRRLGGSRTIRRLLQARGLDITRQAISVWGKVDRISPDYCLPFILICQDDNLDWRVHPQLVEVYRKAFMVVQNAKEKRAA